MAGQSWDHGTATLNGLFPRSSAQRQLLSAFGSSKIGAWCDSGDPYRASGLDLTVHLTYLDQYQNAAVNVVQGKTGGRPGPRRVRLPRRRQRAGQGLPHRPPVHMVPVRQLPDR